MWHKICMFYFSPYSLLPFFSSAVTAALALFAFRRRKVRGAVPLFWLVLGMSGWSLAYALNVSSSWLEAKAVFMKAGICFAELLAVSQVAMALESVDMRGRFSRMMIALISIFPVAVVLSVLTSGWHDMLVSDYVMESRAGLQLLTYSHGPFFDVHYLFVTLTTLMVMALYVYGIFETERGNRLRFVLLIAATALPVIVENFGITPVKGLSLVTSTFCLAGAVMAVAILRYGLFELVPEARERLFEVMADPVLVTDSGNRLMGANAVARALFHLEDGFYGTDLGEAIKGRGELTNAVTSPGWVLAGTRVARDDRGGMWHVTVTALEQVGASHGARLIVLRDVTDRDKAEEALRDSERRFRMISENSSDVIWVLNIAELRLTYVSPSVVNLRGYTPAEVMGQTIDEVLSPWSLEWFKSELPQRLAGFLSGEDTDKTRTVVIDQPHRNGTVVNTEVAYSIITDDKGMPVEILGVSRNVTERRKTEETLRESEARLRELNESLVVAREAAERASAEKTRFLSIMSHEMRTPLHAILGAGELLAATGLDQRQKGYMDAFRRSGSAMKGLLDDMLDFSLIEAGRLELHIGTVGLDDLLEDLKAIFAGQFTARGLTLSVARTVRLPAFIKGDRRRLLQVLSNLTGNALKFTDSGGVSVVLDGPEGVPGRLEVTVSDTGVGISPGRLGTLFEPFSRTVDVKGGLREGTGLGLSISKRLVGMMGGTIAVSSRQGEGSVFTVKIPFEMAEGRTAGDGTVAEIDKVEISRQIAVLPPITLLIVDDLPENILLLRLFFEGTSIDVVVAGSGKAALDLFRSQKFGAVLLDIQLQDMKGTEVVREMRLIESSRGGWRTPVIGLSADAFAESARVALDAGCDRYLTRPAGRAQIIKTISELIAVRQAQAAPTSAEAAVKKLIPDVLRRLGLLANDLSA
ncbi:MAG: histidine kinase N-terminal 7TM domain-containing protein, partial [Myxococcota bacterium]